MPLLSNMNYEKIWQKTLGSDEKTEYEFSTGDKYIKFQLIVWGILCLPLLLALGLGLFVFLIILFYWGFYQRAANAFAFTNKRVLVHRGWLSTHTISVDYSKITDIHVIEPFFDRVLTHTGNIAIVTAGTTTDQIVLQHISDPYEMKKKLDALKG